MRRVFGCLVAFAILTSGNPRASADEVDVHAKLLVRALAYDRALKSRAGESVDIIVVSRGDLPNSQACGKAFGGAFEQASKYTVQDLPVHASLVELSGSEKLDKLASVDLDVLFVCPGVSTADALKLAERKNAVTVTGDADLVRAGIAIGVVRGDSAGKARLVVNVATAKAEGMDLTSDLMRIVDVVR
jgi:hypothetical protein